MNLLNASISDCPVFAGLSDHVLWISGGTLTAARQLLNNECDIVMHWEGGRHHAHSDEASGFCYVNDIVVGILELQIKFNKILYVDIDVHHGDGVQNAFYSTSRVFTLSFHRHEIGFFPGISK